METFSLLLNGFVQNFHYSEKKRLEIMSLRRMSREECLSFERFYHSMRSLHFKTFNIIIYMQEFCL